MDLSPSGAKLKPRGEMLPGTAVDVQLQPPAGRAMHVSGVVWRVDSDGMAVLFLKSLPVEVAPVKKLPEGGRRVWR